MANWFTKTVNKIGSAITGNDNYNMWHTVNQVGAGVSGLISGSLSSIPNALAGALAGGLSGGIPGAIAGAVASGAPVVVSNIVDSVNEYNANSESGQNESINAGTLADMASTAVSTVGSVASVVAGRSDEGSKLSQIASGVASAMDTASVVTSALANSGIAGAGVASDGSGVTATNGKVYDGVKVSTGSDGKVKIEGIETRVGLTGWKKDYIPITDQWAKTAPSKG